MMCECADWDWGGADLTREHHPECKSQVLMVEMVVPISKAPVVIKKTYTYTVGGQSHPTACPTCADYTDNNS